MENAIVLKTDANAEPLFYKEINSAFYIWGMSVCFAHDGNIIFGGYLVPPLSEDWEQDVLLQNYDSEGILNWEKTIGGKMSNKTIYKIIPTFDNGYIIGGFSADAPYCSSWLLKIDSLGNGNYDQGWINSVNEEQFNLDVSVYPNPTDNYITIELPEESDLFN